MKRREEFKSVLAGEQAGWDEVLLRLRLREGGTVKGNLNWFLHPFHTYRVGDGEDWGGKGGGGVRKMGG